MSIEDIEDFCEVCGKVVHVNRHGYNAHQGGCKCELIRVKLVREVMHAQGESQHFARWLKVREKPNKGEFINVDGDCYTVDWVEHVADSICALILWITPDSRTYQVNLGRHNCKVPPKWMVDERFNEVCAEYETAKWFRTDVWWRKKR